MVGLWGAEGVKSILVAMFCAVARGVVKCFPRRKMEDVIHGGATISGSLAASNSRSSVSVWACWGTPARADRKLLSALRGVGPEFEAGSGDFHARTLANRGLRVKLPSFRNTWHAPNHKMAGSARG